MILPRIITAVFFIPLVVAVIWLGSLPFFFFVLGITVLGIWEYGVMADVGGYPNQLFLSILGVIMIVMAFYLDGIPVWGPIHRSPSALFVLLAMVILCFIREFFRRDNAHSFLRIITTITGLVLCGYLLGHLLLIRDLRVAAGEGYRFIGRELTFFLVFIIWTVDTGAWLVGKTMGRFPLAPQISPKKTWTGLIGGVGLACFVGWIYPTLYLKNDLSPREGIVLAFTISIIAQISDLAESLMKRSFGVKDSSQLLPGHGGILDRFDAFIFAAPVFYYFLLGTGRFQ